MKKLIILGLSVLFCAPAFLAQEEDKDFTHLFPKQGQFSIGMDMANVIQFIGNSFSSNGTQTPNYSMVAPSSTGVTITPTIYGRYFLSDLTAVRARLGVGIDNSTTRAFVYDDVANIGNPFNDDFFTYEKTVDEWKQRNNSYELGIGIEKRKNLWRIQGYAGVELFGSFAYNRSYYTYGNTMNAVNQTPTTSDFNGSENPESLRPLEINGGNIINYGGGLYAGADFFITKSISIGAEFNLFFFASHTTEQVGVAETFKLGNVYTGETLLTPTQNSFGTSTLGTLNLNIYF